MLKKITGVSGFSITMITWLSNLEGVMKGAYYTDVLGRHKTTPFKHPVRCRYADREQVICPKSGDPCEGDSGKTAKCNPSTTNMEKNYHHASCIRPFLNT